ncbi:MAG: site-specific DNA-methyltransferase [Prevotellaceae bacterium]|nr:site-specific DNA-methyltransferase [Prevotellaceae bacterium]
MNKIICGDALEVLRTFPNESANCVVTSPPYYCLRDYGVSGQIGLEKSPEMYIENLVSVFMECHRILRNDGTMWVVIGDSYAGSGRGWGDKNGLYSRGVQPTASFATKFSKPHKLANYKNKDLVGVPFMLAFALRERGWYLRQDIIWHKPNPMPESVRDRCTKAHEYIFLFSKQPKYYFDHAAMREPANYDRRKKIIKGASKKYTAGSTLMPLQSIAKGGGCRWREFDGQFIRNKRDVWRVPTRAFKEAHFATFPPDLIRPCIEAGCPQNGVVLDCFMGAGTTAVVARELGRNFVGVELNREYVAIARERLKVTQP